MLQPPTTESRLTSYTQASGNVGSAALKHLLAANKFQITIISRTESSATFPEDPSITVKRGSYSDADFLESAFRGNDAALLTFSFSGSVHQSKVIEAAAKAGVKWILPNEFAGDGANDAMIDMVPVFQPKRDTRREIEKLAESYEGLKWVGVVTNPFAGHAIHLGLLGMDLRETKAKMAPGSGKFNITSLDRIGLGISRVLSLPITNKENSRASLEHYANNFLYLSSFSTTQQDSLEALQRVTGTDWAVEEGDSITDRIRNARDAMANGGKEAMYAGMDLLVAVYIGDGLGGDYQGKALGDLKVLGLEEESIDEVFKHEIEAGAPPMAS